MILTDITINNYKNIASADLSFSPNINGFLGLNGMGKSNLLDAIYYMSIGKSHTGMPDKAVIRNGENFTTIRARYNRRGQSEELTLGLADGHPKSFKRQGKKYSRLSQHLGAFPLVLVSPRDSELLVGAPEERRRFIDMIIAQTDALYLDHLIRYTEALKQRNRLLKDGSQDQAMYEALQLTMTPSAHYITRRRRETIDKFAEIFTHHYHDISLTDETPLATYESKIVNSNTPLDELLRQSFAKDLAIGFTSAGPHRDDIILSLNDMPARFAASQGQQKTFTIAMRLAQYEFMHNATGLKPLLLLDDIFDKLDATRVANIVDVVNRDIFGQTFITDTNRDHLDSIMSMSGSDYHLWEVSDGSFNSIQPM